MEEVKLVLSVKPGNTRKRVSSSTWDISKGLLQYLEKSKDILQYLDTATNGSSPAQYVTESKKFLCRLSFKWDSLKKYCLMRAHLHYFMAEHSWVSTLFCVSATDNNDPNYHRLWQPRHISNVLNDGYSKHHTTSEHFAVGNIIILFNGELLSNQPTKETIILV